MKLYILKEEKKIKPDIDLFKKAYETIGKGGSFVRIHKIREFLNLEEELFNSLINDLKRKRIIQLQSGDPSIMTEQEIKNSFTDEKGRLRLLITWKK